MFLGNTFECVQQILDLWLRNQIFKVACARAERCHIFSFNLLASNAPQVLQRVRHNFSLDHINDAHFDFFVVIAHKTLGAQPHGSRIKQSKVN